MKILHVGSSSSPQKVDGVNTTVWLVAREQALLGHLVTLLIDSPPDSAAQKFASEAGVELACVPANALRYEPIALRQLIRQQSPDIVHSHSVFLPKQASLCKLLDKLKIPYIITPNAICPQLLKRGRVKKSLYSKFIEKPRFREAAGITAVTPREKEDIGQYIPNYHGKLGWIPNPVDPSQLDGPGWNASQASRRVVYLGRYDVMHKGLDFLLDVARALPSDVEVHLYGTRDPRTQHWFDKLQRGLPGNISIHGPIFGKDKVKVLTEASLYIQTSRWEVFGISIAEAMYLGVPCAVTKTVNLSEVFQHHDLGCVLPSNAQLAATTLASLLNDRTQLCHWSERSRAYAKEHFQAQTIAERFLEFYQEVRGA